MKIKLIERGWAGHFICGHRCLFRRNTLIEFGDRRIVVSTVGLMQDWKDENKIDTIGHERYYETMAFNAKWEEPYWEANVQEEVEFESPWSLNEKEHESDIKAQKMHELVVAELKGKIKQSKEKQDDKN